MLFFISQKKYKQLRKTHFIYDVDVYILCNTLQSNIMNIIFIEDGNHFYPRDAC